MVALNIAVGFATAAAFSLAIVPCLLRLADSYGLFDLPDVSAQKNGQLARKVHAAPIPRLGGVAIFASFFITQSVWSYETPLKWPLVASIGVFLLGLFDDLISLSARLRLFIQIVLAGVAVYYGDLGVSVVAFTPDSYASLGDPVGIVLGVFILVGAVNSINMIDGLDGLAGGVVLIGMTLLSFLYFIRTYDSNLILYFSVPLIGAILGFLRYNTHPATIFMGDSGSNWLGFMAGILVLLLLSNKVVVDGDVRQSLILAPATHGAPYLPLVSAILCLAVPIFDTACVMMGRLKDGLNPLRPDQRHFHHSLLKLGLSHSQSVSAVYFLALAAGILGIVPILYPRYNFIWLPYLVTVALLLLIPLSVNVSRATLERVVKGRRILSEKPIFGVEITLLFRYWETANRYLLYIILLACPIFAGPVQMQVGYGAASAAFFIVLVTLIRRSENDDFIDSLALSLGAIVLLVANNMNVMMIELSGQRISILPAYNYLFVVLFVSTVLLFFATLRKKYFLFTPSDFLMLAIPMVMLLVPEPYKSFYKLDVISLRSLVVFMSLRTMVKRRKQAFSNAKAIVLIALVFVMLSGVWAMRIVY